MPKVSQEYNLAVLFPEIAKEWHPTKNGALTPDQFAPRSSHKAWWQCKNDVKHEWKTAIGHRTKGRTGCPSCSYKNLGKKRRQTEIKKKGSLAKHFPNLAKEWHPTKNGDLTPEDVTRGSGKKVWWKCQTYPEHDWEATICTRARSKQPSGCPFCSGNKASKENNLKVLFPEIAAEWHPTKNDDLTPDQFAPRSHHKAWWKCLKGHEWEQKITYRTDPRQKIRCLYCAGNKVSKDNNLNVLFPEIAAEWHPTKNDDLTPEQFTRGSHHKAWWKCLKGHEWEAIIGNRTRSKQPSGCPFCSGEKTSKDKKLIF